MTAQKHTPGPWRLVWWGNETYPYPLSVLADNDGAWIARDGTISNPADGHLIAAAPEMLEALKVVAGSDNWRCFVDGEWDIVNDAIAKAEGRL